MLPFHGVVVFWWLPKPYKQVMLELCSIVDILLALPIVKMNCSHLEEAINRFFGACEQAEWQDVFHSKFHWLTHMPKEMVVMGGFLPSCFTQERKHKTTKRYATGMQNLKHYNKSILEEIAVQDLYDLEHHDFSTEARLASKCACSKKVMAFLQTMFTDASPHNCYCCSKVFLSPAGCCNRGDIVLVQDDSALVAGEVISNFELSGVAWTLLQRLTLDSYNKDKAAAKWSKKDGQVMFYAAEQVKCATMWSAGRDESIVTLIPLHLRVG